MNTKVPSLKDQGKEYDGFTITITGDKYVCLRGVDMQLEAVWEEHMFGVALGGAAKTKVSRSCVHIQQKQTLQHQPFPSASVRPAAAGVECAGGQPSLGSSEVLVGEALTVQ